MTMKVKTDPVVIRDLKPSAAVRAWYRSLLQSYVRDMARSMLLHIRAQYRSNRPKIGFAQDAADPVVELRKTMSKWSGRWQRKLNKASADIARMFADKSQRQLEARFRRALRAGGFTVKFQPTAEMRQTYRAVIAEQVGLIRSIPAQFLKDVESSVWSSVMAGGDMDALSRTIRKRYGVAWRRAALIARDQTAKAHAIMENTRRRELGIDTAIWQHSHAGKEPRPTHVAMHGKEFKLAEGMYDSDEGKYVFPGQLINCRCTSRAVIPAFSK